MIIFFTKLSKVLFFFFFYNSCFLIANQKTKFKLFFKKKKVRNKKLLSPRLSAVYGKKKLLTYILHT